MIQRSVTFVAGFSCGQCCRQLYSTVEILWLG